MHVLLHFYVSTKRNKIIWNHLLRVRVFVCLCVCMNVSWPIYLATWMNQRCEWNRIMAVNLWIFMSDYLYNDFMHGYTIFIYPNLLWCATDYRINCADEYSRKYLNKIFFLRSWFWIGCKGWYFVAQAYGASKHLENYEFCWWKEGESQL